MEVLAAKVESIIALDLLVVKSKDIDRSRAFYEELGLSFVREKHGSGPYHHISQDLGVPFELYPTKSKVENHVALGFSVNCIESTRDRLLSCGFVCSEIEFSGRRKSMVARDPDDNRIEIKNLAR
jgi:catechol 2,3-dioxygenase-like lactoylglutathione lyase family enzyme